MGETRLLEPLIHSLLTDDDNIIREAAAEALGKLDDIRAIKAINDIDPKVRKVVEEALMRLQAKPR